MTTDAACDAREVPPARVHPGIVREGDEPRFIYVSPRGELRLATIGPAAGEVVATLTLRQALRLAGAGTTVQLLPGRYYRPAELAGRRAKPEAPVTIRGVIEDGVPLCQICGTAAVTPLYPDLPDGSDWAYLKLRRCRSIVVEDLAVESCWPCFLYAEDCEDVVLRNVRAVDGLYLLFARGRGSRGLVIEDNDWTQDPSGTMWRELAFEDLHHGRYSYYNGALFGSVDCQGEVIFRRNCIRHAFNGIRMTCSRRHPDRAHFCNVDVEVVDNRFEFIRDNAVEPEVEALNWHVRHNRFYNCHAPLSFNNVAGGWWYIYGNEGWFDDRPGQFFQENRGGKLLKLSKDGPFPDKPWFFFNNSFYARTYVIKKADTRLLQHLNNGYQFCAPDDHAACMCRHDRSLLRDFPLRERWDDSIRFDHDVSSKPFDEVLWKNGQEANGVGGRAPGFVAPERGDFRLREGSPARGAGTPVRLAARTDWPGEEDWEMAGTPAAGARQGERLIEGPPFVRAARGAGT